MHSVENTYRPTNFRIDVHSRTLHLPYRTVYPRCPIRCNSPNAFNNRDYRDHLFTSLGLPPVLRRLSSVSGAAAVEISAHRAHASFCNPRSPLRSRYPLPLPLRRIFFTLPLCSRSFNFRDPLRSCSAPHSGVSMSGHQKHRGESASFATNVPQNVTSEG